MFQQMPDPSGRNPDATISPNPSATQAELATARFRGLSADVRGCAILGPNGVLAATGPREDWERPAAELLGAADEAADRRASTVHVATEDGEAYAVRLAGLAMVAVTDRFTLASLVLADMRATLRDLARGAVAPLEEAA